jgi:hypothetical protein
VRVISRFPSRKLGSPNFYSVRCSFDTDIQNVKVAERVSVVSERIHSLVCMHANKDSLTTLTIEVFTYIRFMLGVELYKHRPAIRRLLVVVGM